jgi:hypothetical protein
MVAASSYAGCDGKVADDAIAPSADAGAPIDTDASVAAPDAHRDRCRGRRERQHRVRLVPARPPSRPADGNNVWGNRFVGGGVLNGRLYVLAFDAKSATMRNAMYVYDPTTDTWTTKTAGAFGSGQFGTTALGGQLYGYVSPYFDPPPGRLWSWEPSSETWIIRPTVTPWRAAFVGAGNKLYTLGGLTGAAAAATLTDAVEEYDPGDGELDAARNYPPRAGVRDRRRDRRPHLPLRR